MSKKFFGTDGIRGKVNSEYINAKFAQRIGLALGHFFCSNSENTAAKRVIIGKDTRRSGYMLETALTSGFTSVGMDVFLLGPIPTPAVGLLTKSMRADLGVMISASHNHHEDNGLKFFGADGFKLSDTMEEEIEKRLLKNVKLSQPISVGRVKRVDEVIGRYTEFVKTSSSNLKLNKIKVVIDCANGSAYKCAPQVLWELGAKVIPHGVSPNGFNINLSCGSTNTYAAGELVRKNQADVGICLDGDADRVVLLDETGKEIDGDQLLALIAKTWIKEGRIAKNKVVSTVMSNLGLGRYLKEIGLSLHRTAVGDKNVVEAMRREELNLGGEKSGHIIMSDYATTGDGLLVALQFLSILSSSGRKASEIVDVFKTVPQKLLNLSYSKTKDPSLDPHVRGIINKWKKTFSTSGEIIIRKSGTESLLRIMVQHDDVTLLDEALNEISNSIRHL